MKKLKYLVIHCTATPEGREVTSDDIRQWHLSPPPKGRGWHQVGYSAMVHINGTIEQLVDNNDDDFVDPWEVTNGAAGYNSVSRHIVYVGGLDINGNAKDTRTPAQMAAMRDFVKEFHEKHPAVQIIGHHDLNNAKDCPCFDVKAWIKEIGL